MVTSSLPVKKALLPQTQPVMLALSSPSPDTVMVMLLLLPAVKEVFTPAALASDGAFTRLASGWITWTRHKSR